MWAESLRRAAGLQADKGRKRRGGGHCPRGLASASGTGLVVPAHQNPAQGPSVALVAGESYGVLGDQDRRSAGAPTGFGGLPRPRNAEGGAGSSMVEFYF